MKTRVPALAAAALAALGALAAPLSGADRIELEGERPGHLQDVWWDGGSNLWWACTHHIARTDRTGKIIAKADVEGHNAGLQARDGRLYVAVCPMQNKAGGKTTAECRPQVNVYDAETLRLLEHHVLDGQVDRSGSLAILPDGTFVLGCLRPPDIAKTQVRFHHLGRDYRILESVVLDDVEVLLGIETIKYLDGELYLSMYKDDGLLVVLDAKTFKEKRRLTNFNGTPGLVFDGTSAWCGQTNKKPETGLFKSSLVRRRSPAGRNL